MAYNLERLIERYGVTDDVRVAVGCDLAITVDASYSPDLRTIGYAALLNGADLRYQISSGHGPFDGRLARDVEVHGLVAAIADFQERGLIPKGSSLLIRNDNDLALRFLQTCAHGLVETENFLPFSGKGLQFGHLRPLVMRKYGRERVAEALKSVLERAELSRLVVRYTLGHRFKGDHDPAGSLCDTLAKAHMKFARRQEKSRLTEEAVDQAANSRLDGVSSLAS